MQAMKEIPRPTNVKELRSFMGTAIQFNSWNTGYQYSAKLLNELLKPTTAWHWLDEHQAEWENIRDVLSNPMKLSAYNPKLKNIAVTDAASLKGIGWILTQHVRF